MRSKTIIALLSILLIICFSFSNALADKIIIAGDEWCPYNCEPNTAKPGYMVEIAQKAFTKTGHTLEYQVMPWERAVNECREGKINGIIGAYKEDAPDFVFPKNELAMNSDAVFVKKEKNWTYKDISSFSAISIGVIKGYAYGVDELNEYIKANSKNEKKVQMAFGDTALQTNIKKLANDRLDAVIESPAVFWYMANQMKMSDKFKDAGKLAKAKQAYIAFSPAKANPKSDDYAKILTAGVDELRKSGELKTILKKYGLDDWK